MPRSKNKVFRPKPCKENVKNAVQAVVAYRMSIRKASTIFNISKTLIGHYVKKHQAEENIELVYKPHNDVKRVFTDQEERPVTRLLLKGF
jgi:transposase